MLSVEEFTCGSLSEANPTALVLPRNNYEETFIVGQAEMKKIAVFIGIKHRFHWFECDIDKTHSWSGLIVNGVTVEVDDTSACDLDNGGSRIGCLVRRGTKLCIRASNKDNFGQPRSIPLIEDLAALPEQCQVAFSRWQIVIGKGFERRVLKTIDVLQDAI